MTTLGLCVNDPPSRSAQWAAVDRQLNALLGSAETNAMLGEAVTTGVPDGSITLMELLRWLTQRVSGPLRDMTCDEQPGAIQLAAAHAADGLQRLLGVCAAGRDLTESIAMPVPAELATTRQVLSAAIATIDILPAELAAARHALSAAIIVIDHPGRLGHSGAGCVTVSDSDSGE